MTRGRAQMPEGKARIIVEKNRRAAYIEAEFKCLGLGSGDYIGENR